MECREQQLDVVTWDEFLPDIMPYVRSAPAEMVMHMARNAAILFAKQTLALSRLYYADVYKDVEDYRFTPTDGYMPIVVKRVLLSGRRLPVLTEYPEQGSKGAFYAPPGTIYVAPPPTWDDPDGLEIEVALAPSVDSCSLDRAFFDLFYDGIRAKAIHDLVLMKGTEWYDPAAASRWYGQYLNTMKWGRVRARRGFQSGPVMAKTTARWY